MHNLRTSEQYSPGNSNTLPSRGFPIGQRLRFDYTGSAVMPCSIDPISMRAAGISREYAEVWPDRLPLQYSMLHLGKSGHVGARLAKNGALSIMVAIDGRAKGRGKAPDSDAKADVGIHLRRVAE